MSAPVPVVPPAAFRCEAALELPIGAVHGQLREPVFPQYDRVARKQSQRPGLGGCFELSRSFPLSPPRLQVAAIPIERPRFLRPGVSDEDPPVGKHGGTEDPVKEIGILTLHPADRDERLRPEPPVQPRTLGRAGVLDNADPGAIAELGPGPRRVPGLPVFRAGQRRQRGHGRRDVNPDASHLLPSSTLWPESSRDPRYR